MRRTYKKDHDLSLPAWGPYSKRYAGISHIPAKGEGKRFDLSVFPALYRRGVTPPNAMWESGYHPWDCNAGLTRFTHRHELLWKDRIFSDISFRQEEESLVRFSCRTVNNTDSRQAVVFHLMNALHFPPLETYSSVPVRAVAPPRGEGIVFCGSLDYESLNFREDSPLRNLSPDGTLWGEIRDHGLTDGSGLGGGFGLCETDEATYGIPDSWDRKGNLHIRFRAPKDREGGLLLKGGLSGEIRFTGTGEWETVSLNPEITERENYSLSVTGGCPVELDGFVFCGEACPESPLFTPVNLNPRPDVLPGPGENSLILKYESLDCCYGLGWDIPGVIRRWEGAEPDNIMKHNVHEHNNRIFKGDGQGHFTEVFTRPIYLEASSEQVNGGIVCSGTRGDVWEQLEKSGEGEKAHWTGFSPEERFFPEDNGYAFSLNRLAATALLNVVYPVRLQGKWIRHHTPGKWWDCLYTWDSGFIGLGFSVLDLKRAEETLNTYLTEPDNPHAAFIHHGSPVPTQFFLYQEIFNRTGSLSFLQKHYDSLLRYHRFLAGRDGSSTTGLLKSGLLKTWDYFYNSGGWDDYSPQVHVRKEHLEEWVTPAITTALAVRTALILKGAARLLDRPEKELDVDIENFSRVLQNHSWDGDAGYFSYVTHDRDGAPDGILTCETGENYNAGFDGAYPLNGGICTPEQERILLGKLFSPRHLWTDSGLTAIDQSAPYFKDDGYWNGAVWMSHQWIFWKTMLDMGLNGEAWRIASTALDLWKRETEDTYYCFEHFVTSTGRGAGWHHFGGLSSPLLNWYAAYFLKGRISVGHDTWVRKASFSHDYRRAEITLLTIGIRMKPYTVLAVMDSNISQVTARMGNREILAEIRHGGTVELQIPAVDRGVPVEITIEVK